MKSATNDEPRTAAATDARALLEEQRASGLNIATFARSKGIPPWVLYNARAQERRRASRARSTHVTSTRASSMRFTKVDIVDPVQDSPGVTGPIELALPSGVVLRVRRDFDELTLRRLLGVIGSC